MIVQAQFPMDNSEYLRALEFARANKVNPEDTQAYLAQLMRFGKLERTDVQTIWRAVFRVWRTPFDPEAGR